MSFEEWKDLQEEFGIKTMDIPFQEMSIQDGRNLLDCLVQLQKEKTMIRNKERKMINE